MIYVENLKWIGSLGVESTQEISTEARISHSLMVVVMNVGLFSDSWELDFLEIPGEEKIHSFELLHPVDKLVRVVDFISIILEGFDHLSDLFWLSFSLLQDL